MDPDTLLKNLLENVKNIQEKPFAEDDIAVEVWAVLDAVKNLDDWICNGGFIPARWRLQQQQQQQLELNFSDQETTH